MKPIRNAISAQLDPDARRLSPSKSVKFLPSKPNKYVLVKPRILEDLCRRRLNRRPSNLLNRRLQRRRVRTDHLGDLLATFEDNEGWHGADADFLCDVWDIVDVDLDEVGGGV